MKTKFDMTSKLRFNYNTNGTIHDNEYDVILSYKTFQDLLEKYENKVLSTTTMIKEKKLESEDLDRNLSIATISHDAAKKAFNKQYMERTIRSEDYSYQLLVMLYTKEAMYDAIMDYKKNN